MVSVFAWQAALKKAEVNLELLIDIEMLLMMEKELEKEYVTQFIDMQKLMINIRKIMIKTKNHCILNIGL